MNPDIAEATKLKEWYISGGDKAVFTSVSTGGGGGGGVGGPNPRKLIADIDMEALGTGEKPSYFELKVSIVSAGATQEAGPDGKKRAWYVSILLYLVFVLVLSRPSSADASDLYRLDVVWRHMCVALPLSRRTRTYVRCHIAD